MNKSSLISGSKALAIAEAEGLAYGVQPVSLPIVLIGAALPKSFSLPVDVVLKNFFFDFTTEGDVEISWQQQGIDLSVKLERGLAVVIPANTQITLSSNAVVAAFQVIFWPCLGDFRVL